MVNMVLGAILFALEPVRTVIRYTIEYGGLSVVYLINFITRIYRVLIAKTESWPRPKVDPNLVLTPNMVYRYCGGQIPEPVTWDQTTVADEQQSDPCHQPRPLVLVLSWTSLVVKDRSLEKYRQFWYKRGFDVLTLRMSPLDVILPRRGGLRNAQTLINFLWRVRPRYNQVLVHGFCGGGYQFCELLYQLLKLRDDSEIDLHLLPPTTPPDGVVTPGVCPDVDPQLILKSFRGFIADSISYPNGYFRAVAEIITNTTKGYKQLQKVIEIWFLVASILSNWMVHYYRIYATLEENEKRIPALFLYSINDHISDYRCNANLYQRWKDRGILVWQKCWERSVHAEHYRNYPKEYGQEVDRFIEMLPELRPIPPPPTTVLDPSESTVRRPRTRTRSPPPSPTTISFGPGGDTVPSVPLKTL